MPTCWSLCRRKHNVFWLRVNSYPQGGRDWRRWETYSLDYAAYCYREHLTYWSNSRRGIICQWNCNSYAKSSNISHGGCRHRNCISWNSEPSLCWRKREGVCPTIGWVWLVCCYSVWEWGGLCYYCCSYLVGHVVHSLGWETCREAASILD